jgi:2,4-dienoyl-CoA reductase-like NADH-dependent reductase (Old Yellow Enzyme family)/thioredoxin reductase
MNPATMADRKSHSPNRYDRVWEPLTIGPVRVRNRIMQNPHGLAWEQNLPRARQIAYFQERARGGAGLLAVGATPVHRSAASGDVANPVTVAEPGVIPLYKNLADAVHAEGAAVMIELAEVGVHSAGRRFDGRWQPVRGPSQVPSVVRNELPLPVDRQYIDELRTDFAAAAVNLREAGIDGLYLHAAHSYLFGQFLSPAYNFRDDEYGGSAVNRCRLILEIADEVRSAVGSDLAVGLRMSYNEYVGDNDGITPELSDEYIHILDESGVFDFFDISTGGYHSLERSVPPMHAPEAHVVGDALRAKKIVKPTTRIFTSGRVLTIAKAEELLIEGVADMVGMTRAQIADPHLVRKAQEGREEEIHLCVGSNECIFSLQRGQFVSCTANPATGRELDWGVGSLSLLPVDERRHVAVVGAGPAGLRAAAVAAERGHRVTVFDENEHPGGSLLALSNLPARQQWSELIDNHTRQFERLGVTLRAGVRADADVIAELAPDAVVVATGSDWDTSGYTPALPARRSMPGVDQGHVITYDVAVDRALENPRSLGGHVVIVDETGDYHPLALAEQLAGAEVSVEVVSRHLFIGELASDAYDLRAAMERLVPLGVRFRAQTIVEEIAADAVHTRSIWGGDNNTITSVDSVVLAMLRRSVRTLFDELSSDEYNTYLIGDALAPRRPVDATYEGERVARLI